MSSSPADLETDDRVDGFGTIDDLAWTPLRRADVLPRLDHGRNPFLRRSPWDVVVGGAFDLLQRVRRRLQSF